MTGKIKQNVTVRRNGKRVTAKWLANRGYSVSAAAQACGVSAAHLSCVLRGVRVPGAALVERLRGLPRRKAVPCRVWS